MSNKKTDWKSKYYELRSRHINAIDVSFRLGFQEGVKASELQNMQMQMQQAQQAAAAGMSGGGEMPPEAMGGAPEGEGDEEEMAEEEPEGDELDSSISELESLVTKKEKIDFSKMLKSLHKSGANKKNNSELSEKHKVVDDIIKKWDEKK